MGVAADGDAVGRPPSRPVDDAAELCLCKLPICLGASASANTAAVEAL